VTTVECWSIVWEYIHQLLWFSSSDQPTAVTLEGSPTKRNALPSSRSSQPACNLGLSAERGVLYPELCRSLLSRVMSHCHSHCHHLVVLWARSSFQLISWGLLSSSKMSNRNLVWGHCLTCAPGRISSRKASTLWRSLMCGYWQMFMKDNCSDRTEREQFVMSRRQALYVLTVL
jgi:hypothetical protein